MSDINRVIAPHTEEMPPDTNTAKNVLLDVRNLKKYFPITKGLFARVQGHVRAVDDVSFSILQGETLGLVGESGCGKTTIGRCIGRAYQPTAGQILYQPDQPDTELVDLARLGGKDMSPFRKEIRYIFQDPYSSLNPRMTVYDIISEVLHVNGIVPPAEYENRVIDILQRVGLRPEYIRRYPHAFSGGERQRLVIARALVTQPRLVIADEAVSALDVSIRAQILNLMKALKRELDLTYLFVSHDLSVIRHICNRVVVMYVGKVIEVGDVEQLFSQPKHPYTEALLSAVPIHNPRQRNLKNRIRLAGEIADPANPPTGCYFHPRCGYAKPNCVTDAPPLRKLPGTEQLVACHYAEELALRGAVME
jgi:peptide/nickel transport system ATP-binding protein